MPGASTDVLVDRIPVGRSAATDAIWVVAFSLVTAAGAQISIHLPHVPVPITGQTFAVLLSGAMLGWRRGFLSQLAYLAEGAAGLPVFADGAGSAWHLLGPSGGYLWAFPLAAALVGYWVETGVARSAWKLMAALGIADLLILLAGSSWLELMVRAPFAQLWPLGFYPFVLVEAAKIALVGCSLPHVVQWCAATFDVAADFSGDHEMGEADSHPGDPKATDSLADPIITAHEPPIPPR